MRADGVVDFFPLPQLTIEFFHLQGAGRDLVELLGVGTVGTFNSAIEFGRAWRQPVKAVARVWAWITSQRETTSRAVNCLKTTPGTGRTSRVSTSTRSPGANTAYCLGLRTA